MSKYVFDANRIDTTPGNPLSPFSPPHGWDSEFRSYRDWLRSRFKPDPNLRQRLGLAVRSLNLNRPVEITGEFQNDLMAILQSMQKKSCR